MSRSSRYDKYIDLFGKSGDYRVRWYLQWYEENYNKKTDEIDTTPLSNSVMMNKTNVDQTEIANEVQEFWLAIAQRLQGLKKGMDIENMKKNAVNAFKQLGTSTDPEVNRLDDIVFRLITQIAVFKSASGPIVKLSDARNAVSVDFTAAWVGNKADTYLKAMTKGIVDLSGDKSKQSDASQWYITSFFSGAKNAVVSAFKSLATFWPENLKWGEYKDDAVWFPLNQSKMIVHLLMENFVKNYQEIPESNFFKQEYSTADDAELGKYRRNAAGNLIDDKGNEVFVGSNYARALLQPENKCASTGFANEGKCSEYLKDCLLNKQGGVEKCKEYMKDPLYWTNAKNEVEAMLPELAVKTLDQFGFDRESVMIGRNNIMRFKTVEQWSAKLAQLSSLNKDEHKAIANNSELMGYLRMLVAKVNSSPAILNPELSDQDRNKATPNMFVGTRLFALGIKPRHKKVGYSAVDFMKFGEMIKHNNSRLAQSMAQNGGASAIENFQYNIDNKSKQTWFLLKSQYELLSLRLKNMGKSIAPNDDAKVKSLLDNLKSSELKLKHAILYTEKYAKLLETMGHADKAKALSFDHLKDFVDKRNQYFTRVAKKQTDLISIIQSVANLSVEDNEQSDIVDVRSL
jgi:hypothetical protein